MHPRDGSDNRPSGDIALAVLPGCEDDPHEVEAALRHVAARKASRRAKHLGVRGQAKRTDFELIGGQSATKDDGADDELDDSFFTVADQDAKAIRLTIGSVPRRAGIRIKRTLRGKGRKSAPDIVIQEVDDTDIDLEDDDAFAGMDEGGTAAALSTAPSSISGDRPRLQGSASSSRDSLVSLELPAFNPMSSASSRSTATAPTFAPLSPLSTLTALRTTASTASTSTAGSTFAADPPSRRLTIDDRIAPVSRRDTFASLHRVAGKRGIHLPGRPHFPQRSKASGTASAVGQALGLDERVAHALTDAGVLVAEKDRVVVDVLYEHQRGLVVFGLPKFSPNLLSGVDPPQWCDEGLKPSAFTPHTYPLPPYWVWRDSEFMIDMGGDKDEEGWSYAMRFRSRFWRGEAYPLRSFVRRRRWIRTRVYRPQNLPLASSAQAQHDTFNAAGSATSSPPEYDPSIQSAITDLHSACAALPLAAARRAALLAESSSPVSYKTGLVPPSNPFLSYRSLKLEAASSGLLSASERASDHESRWRDAVTELNYRRAMGVMRVHTKIDRQRLELWKLWLGAHREAVASTPRSVRASTSADLAKDQDDAVLNPVRMEAAHGATKETGDAGRKAIKAATGVAAKKERTEVWGDALLSSGDNGPDFQDVWDVVEARLHQILASFDYHYTRILFLELVLSQHPDQDPSHRYKGCNALNGAEAQQRSLERGLEDRLAFFDGVKELVAHYGAQDGWLGAQVQALDSHVLATNGANSKASSGQRAGKGKRRAN